MRESKWIQTRKKNENQNKPTNQKNNAIDFTTPKRQIISRPIINQPEKKIITPKTNHNTTKFVVNNKKSKEKDLNVKDSFFFNLFPIIE